MYHVRLFIVEKMGFGIISKRCGICSKPQPLLQKIYLSYASETLTVYTLGFQKHKKGKFFAIMAEVWN